MQNQYNLMIVFKCREIRKGNSSLTWRLSDWWHHSVRKNTGGGGDTKCTPLVLQLNIGLVPGEESGLKPSLVTEALGEDDLVQKWIIYEAIQAAVAKEWGKSRTMWFHLSLFTYLWNVSFLLAYELLRKVCIFSFACAMTFKTGPDT